ncbi:hypothetical protein IMG5_140970 [Ichthyophthirius multifiliis]|uniref:Transmembrane protein n=1 Tax=Ichthyophthirius multifiliis TaxID=5932 RepID=G0QXC2_ICHMU|nr:hypothetical protein IMG5_140970 [Ichthyophthirius multifiliis]EGR30132.1 hypothetical protein IMG5_140970 [Ichthyophthirius multifiliis]|eukprot:XP_004031368.1 hypothetical protein IMG5_140970 [Ichthyophthirius multifiliis]
MQIYGLQGYFYMNYQLENRLFIQKINKVYINQQQIINSITLIICQQKHKIQFLNYQKAIQIIDWALMVLIIQKNILFLIIWIGIQFLKKK